MSLINEYRSLEVAIAELQARQTKLQGSEELQKEIAFEKGLRELLAEHGKSLKDVIAILDPQSVKSGAAKTKGATAQRASRKVKRYTNPNNGEVVDTKGGNHKTIKDWKAQFGADVVESWAKVID